MRKTSHYDGVINILQGIFKKRGLPIVRESGSGTGKFLLVESGLRETFAYGICNPGPYFGIQLKKCRIPRTIGIHNPSSTVKDWDPVPGIRNPRLGIQNPRLHYMGRRGAHVLAGLAFANGTGKSLGKSGKTLISRCKCHSTPRGLIFFILTLRKLISSEGRMLGHF